MLDLVAFAKVTSREKFQFWARQRFFPQKINSYENLTKLLYFWAFALQTLIYNCQHVYSQYVSFSLGMIFIHESLFSRKKHWRHHTPFPYFAIFLSYLFYFYIMIGKLFWTSFFKKTGIPRTLIFNALSAKVAII